VFTVVPKISVYLPITLRNYWIGREAQRDVRMDGVLVSRRYCDGRILSSARQLGDMMVSHVAASGGRDANRSARARDNLLARRWLSLSHWLTWYSLRIPWWVRMWLMGFWPRLAVLGTCAILQRQVTLRYSTFPKGWWCHSPRQPHRDAGSSTRDHQSRSTPWRIQALAADRPWTRPQAAPLWRRPCNHGSRTIDRKWKEPRPEYPRDSALFSIAHAHLAWMVRILTATGSRIRDRQIPGQHDGW